jgi:hypothetical protein
MGVDLGGMSEDQAENALIRAWRENVEIRLVVEGETLMTVRPDLLGIQLDAAATAKRAKGEKFGAFPFGSEIEPVVEVDYLTAQNYLLDLEEQVNILPYNAGYEWRDDELVGVYGESGRTLNVQLSIDKLQRETGAVLNDQRFELLTITQPPEMTDPSPYLDRVRQLTSDPIELVGYDPYRNQYYTWPIAKEIFAEWLVAGRAALTLREDVFLDYLDALNDTLNPPGQQDLRFLAPQETTNKMRDAIINGERRIDLRVRYHPTTYVVEPGDTAFRISRKTGIPYFDLVDANDGDPLDFLSPGQIVNVPSRDLTMPVDPISSKRIVVNLDTQYLMAFENGQTIFEWPISSGVNNAPTSPGIYQILGHDPVAYGSSSLLCDTAGLICGQWEMNWFMGIYSVREGLVNGFHGGVLLPNGNQLGEGAIGTPATFGCVMSPDVDAKALYDWAEDGTVVEIISSEYQPLSDLGLYAAQQSSDL